MMVVAVCPTRNFIDSIDPTQVISGTKKRANCASKRDVVTKNHKHGQKRSSNNASSVTTVSTRTRKSKGVFEACSNFDSQVLKKLSHVWECSTNEKQLRSLGSYFGRLQGVGSKKKMDTLNKIDVLDTGQHKAKKELQLLDAYFQKVDKETNTHNNTYGEKHEGESIFSPFPFEDHDIEDDYETPIRYGKQNNIIQRSIPKSTTQLQEDEVCDLYLISTLVSVNIAVFLFEVASPVKNSDLPLFSLPSVYGAKINDLIVLGEWWRLLTPMFLHSGVVHVALSCWALLTFGRQVCREYGPFAFLLIYVLGGVSGNLTSFLHTSEPTVGGTGPVFAMIGAWLSYQYQNKDVVSKDVLDSMFFKAIIAAAISSILSSIGPIDEWSHTVAAFSGMLYGILTSPIVEVNNGGSRRAQQQKEIKLVRNYADPCKSFAFFALFIMGFTTLLFFIQPPPTTFPFYPF